MTLDMEFNQPSGSIIQLGTAVGDTETGEVVHSLSLFINCKETLSDYIMNLTGIKQNQVDTGIDLTTAYKKIDEIRTRYNVPNSILTWGFDDVGYLLENLNNVDSEMYSFDLKNIYQFNRLMQNKPLQGGLSNALVKLGGRFIGHKHNAKDDAINTFQMAMLLQNKQFSMGVRFK